MNAARQDGALRATLFGPFEILRHSNPETPGKRRREKEEWRARTRIGNLAITRHIKRMMMSKSKRAGCSPERAGVGGSIPSLATSFRLFHPHCEAVTSPIVLPDWKHSLATGSGSTGSEVEYAAASPGICSEEMG